MFVAEYINWSCHVLYLRLGASAVVVKYTATGWWASVYYVQRCQAFFVSRCRVDRCSWCRLIHIITKVMVYTAIVSKSKSNPITESQEYEKFKQSMPAIQVKLYS